MLDRFWKCRRVVYRDYDPANVAFKIDLFRVPYLQKRVSLVTEASR